ncbi:MAG: AraC family transcriptional regulator [Armatimonadota bacterium]|nr:AraC family transcriptional regulator [bacterium]
MHTHPILSQTRLFLEFEDIGFYGKLLLGRYQYSHAMVGLAPHKHEMMEIVYLARGMQTYEQAGERYVLRGNDIFISMPGEEHHTGGYPQEKGILYWLQVKLPEAGEQFLTLSPEYAAPLVDQLRALPKQFFRGTRRCRQIFDDAILAWLQAPEPVRAVAITSRVVELLLEVIKCASSYSPSVLPPDIRRIVDYIEEHLDETTPVSALAKMVNLSTSRFKVKFKQVTGFPPAEYMLRRRVDRAKDLLRDSGMTVTDVAFALGFSSSQYFATVFKRFTRQSPTGYIKSQTNM